jgi:hypothetical protein
MHIYFSYLFCVMLLFFYILGSWVLGFLGSWVLGFLGSWVLGFLGSSKILTISQAVLTSRSSIATFGGWTVFKSQFYGFAAQKYSIKLQLKICRLARR